MHKTVSEQIENQANLPPDFEARMDKMITIRPLDHS
jgi:hypothetical protein